jgi:hypothetical protein
MANSWIRLAGVLAPLALAACAGNAPGGGASHRDPIAWQGASLSELMGELGQPQSRASLASGETVLQYSWTSSYVAGGYTSTADSEIYSGSNINLPRIYQPTHTVQLPCTARFTIGTDNRVHGVESHGAGC